MPALLGTVCLGAAAYNLASLHEPVSRRSANGAYIAWVVSCSTYHVLIAWLLTPAEGGAANAVSIHAFVSRHFLLIFLVANILTGLVNLLGNPYEASTGTAVGLMVAYHALTLLVSGAIA